MKEKKGGIITLKGLYIAQNDYVLPYNIYLSSTDMTILQYLENKGDN